MKPHETFKANKPRVGQTVTYEGKARGIVTSVEGGICYYKPFDPANAVEGDKTLFIWCFRDGLNKLHTWD